MNTHAGAAHRVGLTTTKKMRKKKPKHGGTEGMPDLIDCKVTELVILVSEVDNSSQPRAVKFREEVLVDYLQRNVEDMYPHLGTMTYRVPDVHFNKEAVKFNKEVKIGGQGIKEYQASQETDKRSDRAHSFICDMIQHLSLNSSQTGIPPLFILSSYEYDHFLSRLKSSFKDNPNAVEASKINWPSGSGVERGEADIILLAPGHVIFLEVKAVGDNFDQYNDTDKAVLSTVEKAIGQLVRDEKVFSHVFQDLSLNHYQLTQIVALPNLLYRTLQDALGKDDQLLQKCKNYKFLCKDHFPRNRLDFRQDFEGFTKWWKQNVFYMSQVQFPQIPGNELVSNKQVLDDLKVIVGRYVGFLSVVSVSSRLGSHRKEIRRKGQAALCVGKGFSDIVLTRTQRDYILKDVKLGYLCGPPGSGKTVVLTIRARRWIMDTGNYVVVVNMYRGESGRAIGKRILKSIVEHSNEEKRKELYDHCLEVGLDVDDFHKEQFLQKVTAKWSDIGAEGERIMFLVDETYVENYWRNVFTALREDFKESCLWCAGLYGEQPNNFDSMKLKEVIRCPPKIQHVLSLIDWNDERKDCYVLDSTTASLPTDGPLVLTIRHSEHEGFTHKHPSQCQLCGEQLLLILQDQLNVEKPEEKHQSPDLMECTLKCSDVLLLVNMPRSEYKQDEIGFLDTTKVKYKTYMKGLKQSPMLKVLHDAGYPYKVQTNLKCPDLVSDTPEEVINVTWIYTYQGLENTVVIFLPGDEGVSDSKDLASDLTDPKRNIPCPGLHDSGSDSGSSSDENDCEGKDESISIGLEALSVGSSRLSKGPTSGGEILNQPMSGGEILNQPMSGVEILNQPMSGGESLNQPIGGNEVWNQPMSGGEIFNQPISSGENLNQPMSGGEIFNQPMSDGKMVKQSFETFYFKDEDVNRYSRWDKNNLFITASRCTSQLILITQ